MSDKKSSRPKARLPRGFRDRTADEIARERAMLDTIRRVYESYGFEPLETPAFEYTDALGKFLPDVDRPNEGVFSLKDDDEQWMSLRYDLTAPLARYVAENFQNLPKPFRRYQVGQVWRNEKPGPGRYREFTQFDADTVGSNSPAADAELIMMVCDALEALGLKRSEFVVRINSRKLLDGLLDAARIDHSKRGSVLRAIDKFDRLGDCGVRALLGKGRKDDSGDFAAGADLAAEQTELVMQFIAGVTVSDISSWQHALQDIFATGCTPAGVTDLVALSDTLKRCGYGYDRARIDTGIVRGLDYYTGAVFEAQLLVPPKNERDEIASIGSLAGGGRYDDLVARFTGQQVPAVGISIGVSRLMSVLKDRLADQLAPLVVVLTMDDVARSFELACELRNADVRAEAYVGTKKMQDQLKYADNRGAAIAVIEGADERAKREVTLKDLALGAKLSKSVGTRADWVKDRPAQTSIKRANLVVEVKKMLARH